MTSHEFRGALRDLGKSQLWLAGKLKVTPQAVNRWAKGYRPVPGYVEFILELLREREFIKAAIVATSAAPRRNGRATPQEHR